VALRRQAAKQRDRGVDVDLGEAVGVDALDRRHHARSETTPLGGHGDADPTRDARPAAVSTKHR